MRKICAILVAMLGVVFCLAADVRAIGGTVYVNETAVMNLGDQKRASQIAETLRKSPSLLPVAIQGSGVNTRIVAGKATLRLNASEVKNATDWATKLREALQLPPFVVAPTPVQVGVDADRFIPISGSAAAKATAESSNGSIAKVDKVPLGVRVRGLQQGTVTVQVRNGQNRASMQVQVLPPAVKLPQSITATVVGDPATQDTIRTAIATNAQMQLKTAPNATVELIDAKANQLAAGATASVSARVRVSAPGTVTTEGTISVKLNNLTLAHKKEGELWYCNHPESIMGPGNLFAAELKDRWPARMLYHHTNATSDPLVVQVVVSNLQDTPAKLVFIPGDGTPHKDPVRVGLEAGEKFVRNWLSGSGEVITIPPRSSIPFAMRRITPGETMSGLCYLRILPGGPDRLLVRTDAVDPRYMDAGWLAAANIAAPWSKAGSRRIGESFQMPALSDHVYPEPFKSVEGTYLVGGRFAFIWLGQKPIKSNDGELQLDGNFGVFYTVKMRMENPTDKPTDVEVVFEASAGYSGAVFVVNGQMRKVPILQSKAEYVLRKVTLAPGASQEITILTVPLSGSSYPALFTVRPAGMGLR